MCGIGIVLVGSLGLSSVVVGTTENSRFVPMGRCGERHVTVTVIRLMSLLVMGSNSVGRSMF